MQSTVSHKIVFTETTQKIELFFAIILLQYSYLIKLFSQISLSMASYAKVAIAPDRTKISAEEKKELEETFGMFDLNHDGKISKDELSKVMKQLGRSTDDDSLKAMIRDADLNGNGVIELDEFIEMMTKQTRTLSSDDSIRQAFRVFDKNGDSFISRDEIRIAMSDLGENLSEKEIDEMLECVDLNKDGKVSFEEFKQMFEYF